MRVSSTSQRAASVLQARCGHATISCFIKFSSSHLFSNRIEIPKRSFGTQSRSLTSGIPTPDGKIRMDPLSALSVAASVIQFVDFGLKLVSDGAELYEKGSLGRNNELELITKDLTRLAADIAAAPTHSLDFSEDEASLKKVAILCREIGDELLGHLEKLRVPPSGNQLKLGLNSFRQSLRSARKRSKLQSIESRLEKARDQVKMNILNLLRFAIHRLKLG
jgi:hypothetical protein